MSAWLAYLMLFMAIISEVIGTSFLGKSAGFTRLVPTLSFIVFYAVSFYLFSLTLKIIPLAIAYATWGGVGIILTGFMGFFVFKQRPDSAAILGIAFIIIGVVIVNGFSRMNVH
ncbi:DMT family transporter [Celerinatantimonas sp. YJH-8]|uniref:DMT family transporter n=1 Tax=Celerinatantimonas sp. YJH-8 TaxID=3228714 RepID=UPI0038CA0A9F